jgi:hypothetical protein
LIVGAFDRPPFEFSAAFFAQGGLLVDRNEGFATGITPFSPRPPTPVEMQPGTAQACLDARQLSASRTSRDGQPWVPRQTSCL